ncbi:MAG TPA: transcriptional regulator [Acidimicrobiales bacterium]
MPGEGDAQNLGSHLRAVRRQMGLSLQAVEAMSERTFKSSVLGAYERGERNITIPRLRQLARLYDVPLDQLLPQDGADADSRAGDDDVPDGSARARRSSTDDSEKITIDLTKLDTVKGPERDPLRRFLSMIQVKRQDFDDKRITIRAGDLHAIAYLFGLNPEAMAQRLGKLGLLVQS